MAAKYAKDAKTMNPKNEIRKRPRGPKQIQMTKPQKIPNNFIAESEFGIFRVSV